MSQCRGRGEEKELQNGRNKKRGKRKGGGKDESQKQRTSKEKWNGVKLAGTNAWSSQDFLWSYLISLSVLPLLLGQTSRMLSGQDGKTGDFRGFFFSSSPSFISTPHLVAHTVLFYVWIKLHTHIYSHLLVFSACPSTCFSLSHSADWRFLLLDRLKYWNELCVFIVLKSF